MMNKCVKGQDQMCSQTSIPSFLPWTEQSSPAAPPSVSTISVTVSPTWLTIEMNGLMQLSDEQISLLVKLAIQNARGQ